MVGGKKFQINNNGIASAMYAFASVLSKGISFLTIPIFTRLLTTSEMGVSTTFNSLCMLLFPVMTLSVTSGTLQVGFSEHKEERDEYSAETLMISSGVTLLMGIILFFFRRILYVYTHLTYELVFLMTLYCFFYAALDIWYTRTRYEHRYVAYTIMSVFVAIMSTGISLLAVMNFSLYGNYNLGIVRIVSQYLVLITVSIFIYFLILIRGKFYFKKKLCAKILKVSWPLVFHTLSKNILDVSDRLMVAFFCGESYAGIYGVIAGFSVIIVILWNSIDAAIVPSIFSRLEKYDLEGAGKISENALFIFLFITCVSVVAIPLIARGMTVEEYEDGLSLIPVLLLSNFFLSIYHVYGTMLLHRKKTVFIMVGTIVAAVTNMVLNYLLLGKYGYHWAAFTTVIAFVVQAILQGVICYREYGTHIIGVRNTMLMSLLCIFICSAGALLEYDDPIRLLLLLIPATMVARVKRIMVNMS